MPTRADIVAAARECVGTPFHHQGRLLGVGLDCVGVVLHAARVAGVFPDELPNYGRSPNPKMMRATLEKYMDELFRSERLDGDVLWLRVRHDPQHLAILCDEGRSIIHSHAYKPIGRCVEQPLDAMWAERIEAVFRFRGIE